MSHLKPVPTAPKLTPEVPVQSVLAQPSPAEVRVNKTPLLSMPLLLLLGLILFLAWASWFKIDQSVRATGQLIPSARTQVIQVADGGVLAQLLVNEGQVVKQGQTLAVLEKQRANASYEESRSRVASTSAALVRAKAEANGLLPDFGNDFFDYPEFVQTQQQLYQQNQASLQDRLTTLQGSLNAATQEWQMNDRLFATGDVSQLDLLRSENQVNEIKGEISAVKNEYLQAVQKEIAKLQTELQIENHKLSERQSVLQHTDITSPVDGVVKYLKYTTLGGVLRSGDELMQISPTQSDLVLEISVDPVDIGQLQLGMPAIIKLDAFDYTIFGSIAGQLDYLSSDTLTEKTEAGSNTYYRARVSIEEQIQNPKYAHVELKPGMTASVDIQTDQRSVLHYLSKPVIRAFAGAFNER